MEKNQTRLNKHLALVLGVSRREADRLIEHARVAIDGHTASLGARIGENTKITVDGEPISKNNDKSEFQYVFLNKPRNYVCSRRQQGESPTIYALLPKELHHLKPVGRLDRDSSGLIILTNDGDFAYKMTHPKFIKQKHYIVKLNKDLEPLHQQMINDFGITLPDGPSKLTLERLSDNSRKDWNVIMHEGRNRQIRRTFDALGYTVVELHRISFGKYQLNNLETGKYQLVSNV